MEPIHDCGLCDGPLQALGRLGRVMWFRCRNCGWDHCSRDCCEDDLDDYEDDLWDLTRRQ